MAEAKAGDTVRVHYTGTLEDGRVFDSSDGREPLEFTVGSGQVIPGFDEAISGMEPGQEKEVTIPSDEAYGERRDDLVLDANHPLAGEDLTFQLRLVEIV
jgi:peptidylprolyl isomerase